MLANKFQKYLINGGGSRGQNCLAQKEKRMSSYKSITQPILDLTDSKNRMMSNCKTIAMTFVIALVALMSQSAFADSEKAGRTTTYFHSNALGSIEAASDEQGQLLWRKHYQPFGTQVQGSDTEEATSFTGKQYDDKIGLSYFGARYYDPQLGRFTSPDPVSALAAVESNSAMFNRYAYANNNPYRYVDPDGRDPHSFDGVNPSDNDGQENPGWFADSEAARDQTGKGIAEGADYSPVLIVGSGVGFATKGLLSGVKNFITKKFTDKATNGAGQFANTGKLTGHFQKHGAEFGAKSADEYLSVAQDVMKKGTKVQYNYKGESRTGFVQLMGNNKKGQSKFAFVGTNNQGNITTLHTKSGKDFWKTLNGNAADKTIRPAK